MILTAMIGSGDVSGSDYMSAADAMARRGSERHRKAERSFREFCEREKLRTWRTFSTIPRRNGNCKPVMRHRV